MSFSSSTRTTSAHSTAKRNEGTEDSEEAQLTYGFGKLDSAQRFRTGEAIQPVDQAVDRASRALLDQQNSEGEWCGELQGDTILESEYVLLLAWLGKIDSPVVRKAANYIIQQQLPSGGWAQFPGGDLDISGSVKAYFALKLAGHDPSAPLMRRARQAILGAGGADAVNSFTRFYLALLGQISYGHCPAVPPEAVLFPSWFPVNIYRVSAWSRTILVPLSIMWAYRPSRQLEQREGIQELFIRSPEKWPAPRSPDSKQSKSLYPWPLTFRALDWLLKFCESLNLRPVRKRALVVAERWMTDRFASSDGLGAIFPPIIWSVVALKCLGYSDGSDEVRECLEQLEALIIEQEDTVRLQPCKSPVWDTAIAVRALAATDGATDELAVQRATSWLLSKEIKQAGDWSINVDSKPGGWCFEYNNAFYPDVDDTIMVIMALLEGERKRLRDKETTRQVDSETEGLGVGEHETFEDLVRVAETKATSIDSAKKSLLQGIPQVPELPFSLSPSPGVSPSEIASACERGKRWVLAMQNRDGGWGAFDKDNDAEVLCHVPFADHNAMIDPSTPDLTGRVLEALGICGMSVGDRAIDRAVEFVRKTQNSDGGWFGRWGVNYIYGTWQVLAGLAAVGVHHEDAAIQRGADWLLKYQQASGGWGESAHSYADPASKGQGPVTPSQTAWALLGLMSAGRSKTPAVERGVRFLVDLQQTDGTWAEEEFTGTGFPRVFYLRYHLYPLYFPLLALSKWRSLQVDLKVDSSLVTSDS